MNTPSVYNFEFPSYRDNLSLNGYLFKRVQNYEQALGQLQHIDKYSDEFERTPNYGGHAITAEVTIPTPEQRSILKWGKQEVTHLDDVLLLLSLFTGRHVWQEKRDNVRIVADHRKYQHDLQGLLIDIGFETGINRVIQHMSDQKWIEKYRGGHYLFLADHAFRRQILETQFSLCFTIWEHLFSIHNDSRLERTAIHSIGGKKKVAFILKEYGIDVKGSPLLDKIIETRNRLIHFGMFPDDESVKYSKEFIKITECLIGRTLGLFDGYSPSFV